VLIGELADAAFGLELLEGAEGEGDIDVFIDIAGVDVEVGGGDAVLGEVAGDESVGGVAPGGVVERGSGVLEGGRVGRCRCRQSSGGGSW
jgi:hypothetical protein